MIPREWLTPYLVANGCALAVLAVAFWRRRAARWIVSGIFVWASLTNAWTSLTRPEVYLDYALLTPSTAYREFILGWFTGHVQAMVFAIACGQMVIAMLLASRDTRAHWLGAAGAWIFLAAISPLGVGAGFPFSLVFGAALFVSLESAEVTSARLQSVIHWAPRIAGVVLTSLLATLALDAFANGQTTLDTMRGFAMHLVPAAIVLVALAVAWRWEWMGGALCFVLAIGYGFLAEGRVSWMLVISLPLVVEGTLFLWSWHIRHARFRRPGLSGPAI